MLAAVIRQQGDPPTIEELPAPEVGPLDALIRVTVWGLRHRPEGRGSRDRPAAAGAGP